MKGAAAFLAALLVAAPAVAASGPPRSNQVVLTARQSQRLVAWANAYQSCLVRQGLDIGRPRATRTQIAMTLRGFQSRYAAAHAALPCGEHLGGPPLQTSLQTFPTQIVLYVPKQCLIDADVAARTRR
jgi:hypothetical protein